MFLSGTYGNLNRKSAWQRCITLYRFGHQSEKEKGPCYTRDQDSVKETASGSGLGYWDLVSSIKKLAVPIADFGMRIAECGI